MESLIFTIKDKLEDEQIVNVMNNPSYEAGLLGLSLFYCYFARFTHDDNYFDVAEGFLRRSLSLIQGGGYGKLHRADSIDNHLSNAGRFLEFCKQCEYVDLDTNEMLGDVDQTLAKLMLNKAAIGDFDLTSGALAAGYYFLSRLGSQPHLAEHLEILTGELYRRACQDEAGDLYWVSPMFENRIYLGISHGSAMVVSFLANVYDANIARKEIREILPRAISFLLKQRTSRPLMWFPIMCNERFEAKHFCLCYGDLGVGYALLRASTVLADKNLSAIANEILDSCLKRRIEDNYTLDASIVYGASGLAATFEKIHSITNDRRFKDAAGYWLDGIPRYAVHSNGLVGFRSILKTQNNTLWNSSFGWGIAGIGISLMRQKDPTLPEFSSLLMIA